LRETGSDVSRADDADLGIEKGCHGENP